MKLTLDTNCLINYFETASETALSVEEIGTLFRHATSGRAEIAITTRVEADMLQDDDQARRELMLRMLGMFEVIGTVARWNVSAWDSGDLWVTKERQALAGEIQKILFPGFDPKANRAGNKVRDIDHIVGHILGKRDVFVTDDRDINRRATELKTFGCVVMKPLQCVDYLDGIASRAVPKSLPSDGINPAYHSRALSGEVSFDYSNNDKRYALGEGHFLFETSWSKGSDASIHAYNDPPSIDAIALAKGMATIEMVADATTYDYSSRFRSPRIGEVVLWRNVNGLYAATRIVSIKDDTRGSDHDELRFEYRILLEGADFSNAG